MKRTRTYNTRLIKPDFSYSTQEIADLFSLHKNAVLRWIGDGLSLIDERKPYLVHGSALIAFLNKRQADRKRSCQADEFFCCKCRAARPATGNVVDIVFRNDIKLDLRGRCAVCSTIVRRVGSMKKLPEYQKIFTIQTMQGRHINDSNHACDNRDIRKEGNDETI